MNTLATLLIFLIVVFLYLHITSQYKISEDLEIYEMDYTTNKQLQEVCDIKQPLLFHYQPINPEFFEDLTIEETQRSEIYVKEATDYYFPDNQIDSLLLPYQSVRTLLITDTVGVYFSENNHDFVEDTGLRTEFETNDLFLKPTMTAFTKYDVCTGSKNCATPLRYHNYYRQFYCVHTGKIRVKMTPFKARKYTRVIKDYDNYEFRTTLNVWDSKNGELDKIKFIEFDVNPGFVLYVPPYWFYSIKYLDDNTLVSGFTYQSAMNCVANLPDIARYYIQQQNTKKKVTKTVPLVVQTADSMEKSDSTETPDIETKSDDIIVAAIPKNNIEEKVAMLAMPAMPAMQEART